MDNQQLGHINYPLINRIITVTRGWVCLAHRVTSMVRRTYISPLYNIHVAPASMPYKRYLKPFIAPCLNVGTRSGYVYLGLCWYLCQEMNKLWLWNLVAWSLVTLVLNLMELLWRNQSCANLLIYLCKVLLLILRDVTGHLSNHNGSFNSHLSILYISTYVSSFTNSCLHNY